ncbi:MAG: hypothetical protein U0559_11205 [Anaerolineae bacterium]
MGVRIAAGVAEGAASARAVRRAEFRPAVGAVLHAHVAAQAEPRVAVAAQ